MNKISINGVTYSSTSGDISVQGNVLSISGQEIEATGIVEIRVLEGSIGELTSTASVSCNDVTGNVNAKGSVNCENVDGNVKAGGSVNCANVSGDVKAGGSINHRKK